MNPVERFLLESCDDDPSGKVPLTEFFSAYSWSLDGNEDEQWRSLPRVICELTRGYRVGRGWANRRFVFGLRIKPIDWALVDSLAVAEAA